MSELPLIFVWGAWLDFVGPLTRPDLAVFFFLVTTI